MNDSSLFYLILCCLPLLHHHLCMHLCAVGPALVPASDATQKFWKGLPHAQLQEEGRVLRLQEGTAFLGEEDNGNQLMIRDFWYAALWDEMQKHFAGGGKGIGIIGNAGAATSLLSSPCMSASLQVEGCAATAVQPSVDICAASLQSGDYHLQARCACCQSCGSCGRHMR